MPTSDTRKHRFGQHYTPHSVARLLAALAVRSPNDLVFDPACGDGRLLEAAIHIKTILDKAERHARAATPQAGQTGRDIDASDGRFLDQLKTRDQVFGVDRFASAVKKASGTGATVTQKDFFDIEPGSEMTRSILIPDSFDAIVGNPPYIRQELVGYKNKQRIRQCVSAEKKGAHSGLTWSGRSDIYVYFFAHAASFLPQGGRLAFLTASSWLDVDYGAPLRGFLLANFKIIALVESAVESFFNDASINTVISVLEKEPDSAVRAANRVKFVRLRAPIEEILATFGDERNGCEEVALARSIEQARSSTETPFYSVRAVDQSALSSTRPLHSIPAEEPVRRRNKSGSGRNLKAAAPRWGMHLRADDVFFEVIQTGADRLDTLSAMAGVRFGVKTGANEFFYVSSVRSLSEMAQVRRGLTTGANEFFYLKAQGRSCEKTARRRAELIEVENGNGERFTIERRFLAPIVFSLKEITGVLLTERHTSRFAFDCAVSIEDLNGTNALAYIRRGEKAGYHRRPTCAAREPWYTLVRNKTPAPLIFPSKVGERWVVALNESGILEDKKLYGVFPHDGVPLKRLAALLNSTWARYYAEMTCRQMTGAQAIADIDVAVAEQVLVPDPRLLSPTDTAELEASLDKISRRPIKSVFQEVELPDRRRLDDVTLKAIGFANAADRGRVLDELYAALIRHVRERLAKASG